MTAPKQQNSFPLRMPAELRARLESRAKENGRSANSEIIAMLTSLLDSQPPAISSTPASVLLEELIARYGAHLQIVVAPDVAEQAGLAPAARRVTRTRIPAK